MVNWYCERRKAERVGSRPFEWSTRNQSALILARHAAMASEAGARSHTAHR